MGEEASSSERGIQRRTFLAAAGAGALTAALAALPRALVERGWLDEAAAADADVTRDTFNGLVAFITPGDEEYSTAQGVSTAGPGGIAAGATPAIIETLDGFVGAPLLANSTGATLPLAGAVAQLLNNVALEVNAASSRGRFTSPFARLSFKEKGEVFRRLESDPRYDGTPVPFVAGILPSLVALIALSDAPVLGDDGRLTSTPLGWQISRYAGPSDGWDEFRGYWRGRRRASGAHRFVRHRHRRRRGGRRRRQTKGAGRA